MKKKSLISLSSLLLASALLVGCGNKTSKQQVESKEEPQVVEPSEDSHNNDESNSGGRSNGVEKCHIHIDLRGASLNPGLEDKTDFITRSGTLWNLLSNLAPSKDDIAVPDSQYIEKIDYSYDEKGSELITPSTPIRSDTNLYLQITHKEPTENYCTVKWRNDGGTDLDVEKYVLGETPFYKKATPKSQEHPSYVFVGWDSTITPIKSPDIGKERIYVARYEKIGVDCTVTYDYNYKIDESEVVDHRQVKQGECAKPLNPQPVRHNYAFDGWYKEQACINLFDFEHTIITDDSTLIYAKWIPTAEHLIIDPNGGTFIDNTKDVKNIDSHYDAIWGDVKTQHNLAIKTPPEGYEFTGYKYEYYDVTDNTWKEIPDDNFLIKTNLSIKVVYTPFTATLHFVDDYNTQATLPSDLPIRSGTKWIDIKNECIPTILTGYEFAHYYISNGEGVDPTVIDDNYVFDLAETGDTITLHLSLNATVNFETDVTKGVVPYSSAKILTGTKWSDVKNIYKPQELNPGAYPFDKYTTNDETPVDVTDAYVFTKPVTLTAIYTTNKVTLTFNDSYQSGATIPEATAFPYGSKWGDIKNQYSPTDVPTGYEFAHYYINNGEEVEPTVIDDNYVFTTDVTLNASWNVTVAFNSDKTKGIVPYSSAKILTGTKWSTIKTTYQPTVVDPTIYQFDKYTTNDATDVTDAYVFTKPVTLIAQYKGAAANSFTNDSWETFTSYINGKTFEQISTEGAYKDEFDGNGGSFVGLTRTVDVQGKTYFVRVIDEASEGSSTLEHSHLLTFEFTNVLDLEVPYSLNANDNCYKNSYIKNYLNNSFVNELPKALKDSIKETPVKYLDTTDPVETRTVKTDNEKLFVLSASELNFTTYPDYTGMQVKDEGSYAYYKEVNENRQKTLLDGTTPVNYWTRSADASGITGAAWNINPDGTLGYLEEGEYYSMPINSGGVYVAPAFEL